MGLGSRWMRVNSILALPVYARLMGLPSEPIYLFASVTSAIILFYSLI
jgi:hypothetical protein